MQFKKTMALFLGTIAFMSYLSLKMMQKDEILPVHNEVKMRQTTVYLKKNAHLIVPLSFPCVNELEGIEEMKYRFGYLSGKQKINGYNGFYSKPIEIKDIQIQKNIAHLYFDRSFFSYHKEDELNYIQALTYTMCTANIQGIKIYVDGTQVRTLSRNQTPLPLVLTRKYGINSFHNANDTLHEGKDLIVYGKYENLWVPIHIRVSNQYTTKDLIYEMFKEIHHSSGAQIPFLKEGIQIKEIKQSKDGLQIYLNDKILDDNKAIRSDLLKGIYIMLKENGFEQVSFYVQQTPLQIPTDLTLNQTQYHS